MTNLLLCKTACIVCMRGSWLAFLIASALPVDGFLPEGVGIFAQIDHIHHERRGAVVPGDEDVELPVAEELLRGVKRALPRVLRGHREDQALLQIHIRGEASGRQEEQDRHQRLQQAEGWPWWGWLLAVAGAALLLAAAAALFCRCRRVEATGALQRAPRLPPGSRSLAGWGVKCR